MISSNIIVTNKLGLHARAAAKVVKVAAGFKSKICIKGNDNEDVVDARSILCILTLAAGKGSELTITADGIDEKEAVREIQKLFLDGFGEGK